MRSKFRRPARQAAATNLNDMKAEDLTGKRFGRLIAVKRVPSTNNTPTWLCLCDCGKETSSAAYQLKVGNTKSCGCLKRERIGSMRRLPDGEAAFRRLFSQRRIEALTVRGLMWNLTKEQARKLFEGRCNYCGCVPAQIKKGWRVKTGTFTYNGIDRVDNTKGYTLDNCVSCCGQCNTAKGQMTVQQFAEWINKVKACFDAH